MEQSQINYFLVQNTKKFTNQDLMLVRQRLEQLDDNATIQLSAIKFRNPTITLVFAWLLSGFGIDGFYSGKTIFGVAKLGCLIAYYIVYVFYIKSLWGMTYYDDYYNYNSNTYLVFMGIIGLAMFILFIIGVVNGAKWTRQYNFKKFMEATQVL